MLQFIRGFSRSLAIILVLGTLSGVGIVIWHNENAASDVEDAENFTVDSLARQVRAGLLQPQRSVAELAAWMASADHPGSTEARLPRDSANSTSNEKVSDPDVASVGRTAETSAQVRIFNDLYRRFATELEKSERSGLIYFGTKDGGLLVAGRYANTGSTAQDSNVNFCDIVIGSGGTQGEFEFKQGDYHEFFVPTAYRDKAVSTYLDQLRQSKIYPDHYELPKDNPLPVHFQILGTSPDHQPWINDRTPRPDLLRNWAVAVKDSLKDRLNRHVSLMSRDTTAIYNATKRPWYVEAEKKCQGGDTISYGLFEYFNGLDLGVSALRWVDITVDGQRLSGVLAVDLARSHELHQLEVALGNLETFGNRKPLGALIVAPPKIAEPQPLSIENSAVTLSPIAASPEDSPTASQPAAVVLEKKNEPAVAGDRATRKASPAFDMQQLILATGKEAKRLGIDMDAVKTVLETKIIPGTQVLDKDRVQERHSIRRSNDTALMCNFRVLKLDDGSLQLPWKVGLIFPSNPGAGSAWHQDPFRAFADRFGVSQLLWPILAFFAAVYFVVELTAHRALLREREEMLARSSKQYKDSLDTIQSLEDKRRSELLEREKLLKVERDALRDYFERQRTHDVAQYERVQELEFAAVAQGAFRWVMEFLQWFGHELHDLMDNEATSAVLVEFVNGELVLAEGLLARRTHLLKDELLTTECVRRWASGATVTGEIRVRTKRHLALRVIAQLVANAVKYRDGDEITCHLRTEVEQAPEAAPLQPLPVSSSHEIRETVPKRSFLQRLFRWPTPAAAVSESKQEKVSPPPLATRPARRLDAGLHFVAEIRSRSRKVRSMAPEEREKLFVLFGQYARKSGGTGLGLYHARMLAQLENGNVILSDGSKPDEIVFSIWLPARLAPAETVERLSPANSSASATSAPLELVEEQEEADPERAVEERERPRVLVLDDDAAQLAEAVEGLRSSYNVAGFQEPEACVQRVPGAHIIVLDFDLGKMRTARFQDGLAVAAAIREGGFQGMLLLHTNKVLPVDHEQKLRRWQVIRIAKSAGAELEAAVRQAREAWVQDPTPEWRAEQVGRLLQNVKANGRKLSLAAPTALEPLIAEYILDPIVREQLLEFCHKFAGDRAKRLLLQLSPTHDL
jgi:signal transduction histidine kinase/CheY-like chemotaxis protein